MNRNSSTVVFILTAPAFRIEPRHRCRVIETIFSSDRESVDHSLRASILIQNKYQEFALANKMADNEDEVKDSVIPAMLKMMGIPSRSLKKYALFNNMAVITEGMAQAKLDYYCGTIPRQINPDVRRHFSDRITLSSLKIYFLEAIGPDGSLVEALRQVCYDGSLGTRVITSLETYGSNDPRNDDRTHSISAVCRFGKLDIYAHSAAQRGGLIEYHKHSLSS
jgi:hypothetical protein